MSDYETLGEYRIERATDQAVAIDNDDGFDEHGRQILQWIPRSVIEDGDLLQEGLEYELEVELWFLEKEGLV